MLGELTAAEVKAKAKECGADIVGIAPMSRWEGTPRQNDPRYIFPGAKSMVVLGFRIPRGLLRGIEEGTRFIDYPGMGYASINQVHGPMVLWKLNRYLDPKSKSRLYPSSLSPYLVCPLKFYFKKVANLATEDELEDNIDSRVFGNILHSAMEILYKEFKDREYIAEDMESLLKGDKIERAVTEAIDKELAKNRHIDKDEYSGDLLLNKNIVIKQIRDNIIPYDKRQSGVAFVGFEETYEDSFPLNDGSGREVNIAGKADRIDSLPNRNLRVVDYKTGKKHFANNDSTAFRVEQLFEGEGRGKYDNVFQTLMYSMVIANNKKRVVQPGLYYIKQMYSKGFKDYLTINDQTADTSLFKEDFEQRLRVVFQELFNPEVPFRQCPIEEAENSCKYCDFKTICRR